MEDLCAQQAGPGRHHAGAYTLVVTSLFAAGYTWNGAELQAEFTVAAQANAGEGDAGQTHDQWLIFLPTIGN